MKPGETPVPPKTAEFGHVVPGGPIHAYPRTGNALVTKRSVGQYDNGVYVVRCAQTNEAILVDAAAEPELLIEQIGDATLIAILETHGHHDHVQALDALVQRYDVPVYAHPGDTYPVPTRPLEDNDELKVGTLTVRALHTPGHTPGSMTFALEGRLLTGDTLFPGGPGSTFGSDEAFDEIMRSLDRLFAEFGEDLPFSPGHGHDSTLDRERIHVETWRARRW